MTFSTLRPEIIVIYTSGMLERRCRTFFVSSGKIARSGCGAIGARVPS
jgi:hypothetical protein